LNSVHIVHAHLGLVIWQQWWWCACFILWEVNCYNFTALAQTLAT